MVVRVDRLPEPGQTVTGGEFTRAFGGKGANAAAEAAARRGWRFVLNPAPARPLPPEVLARCDVLTPNEHEVGMLGAGDEGELLRPGAGAVVVTRGAAGAGLHRAGRPVRHQDAFA